MAFHYIVSLLYCWVKGWDDMKVGWERREARESYSKEDSHVGVCMFVYVWDCLGSVAAC